MDHENDSVKKKKTTSKSCHLGLTLSHYSFLTFGNHNTRSGRGSYNLRDQYLEMMRAVYDRLHRRDNGHRSARELVGGDEGKLISSLTLFLQAAEIVGDADVMRVCQGCLNEIRGTV